MAQTIRRLEQVMRNQGGSVPLWTNVADWCDSIVLVGGTAQSYALKFDAAGLKGSLLRINADKGPVYMQEDGAAVVPTATTTDGSSSVDIIPENAGGTAYIAVSTANNLSFICALACVLTIEAFD